MVMSMRKMFSRVYSFIIALFPFLYILKYNIAGIDIDRTLIIIFSIGIVLYSVLNGKISANGILLFSTLMLCACVTANSIYFQTSGVLGYGIFTLIFLVHIPIGTKYIDVEWLKKFIVSISLIASILIAVQTISYYLFHIYIPFVRLNLLKDYLQEGYYYLSSSQTSTIGLFRPSAFFLEPAHFSQYCLVGLIISLCNSNAKLKFPIIITAGIFLTTSGIGMVFAVFLWCVYFYKQGIHTQRGLKYFFGACVLLMIGVVIADNFGILELLKIRFSMSGNNSGVSGRLRDIPTIFQGFTTNELIFGRGYGASLPNNSLFCPGLFMILYQIGLFGMALFAVPIMTILKLVNNEGKMVIILYIFVLIMADIAIPAYYCFYLPIAYMNRKEIDINGMA